ncbi:MAG: hypothetical protein CL927_10750 [Deltaproteobacteria bacterium]|nr:hypothetical protein [Deltaproteobacteria bacterium]HCH65752.1 hypothetical protein [Deltaproteobacteria bacterium]
MPANSSDTVHGSKHGAAERLGKGWGPIALAVAIWVVLAGHLWWWVTANPLPDGFQNEYLHVGNAYDLWGALQDRDVWHLRYYMYTGYWPWGFYAVPWPFLATLGPGRLALAAGNLLHLVALLFGAHRLGRRLDAPLAPLLLVLCPGVFGSLVRFEPNLAVIAWTVAGVACLVESAGLRRRRWVVAWGACLGLSLMFDRLTVGFFLAPAVLPLLGRLNRTRAVNLAWGVGLAVFLTAAYYREFFLRHTGELLSQAPVGEIDVAGQVTVTGGSVPELYYLLTLVDSQAGVGIGLLMVAGLAATVPRMWASWQRDGSDALLRDPRFVLWATILPGVLLFTLIAKKQVFYTLPILGPLAVLAATRRRLAPVAVLAGIYSFVGLGIGWSHPAIPPGPVLPLHWVTPRHTLAHPPSHDRYPMAEAARLVQSTDRPIDAILVMSEDHQLFEGYVALAMREAVPGASVRGVVTDPRGTYELLAEQDAFVWVGAPDGGWPSRRDIERELLRDHVELDKLPPVVASVVEAETSFQEVGRLSIDGRAEVVVYVRRPDLEPDMR